MPTPRTDGFAIASMCVGIASFPFYIIGFVLGIAAVVLGFLSLDRIKKDPTLQGKGMAVAGIALGFAMIGLWLIFLVILFTILGGNGPFW